MIDVSPVAFDSQQVALLAQMNARGLALGAIAYMHRQGVPSEPYFEFIGRHFCGLWPEYLAADEAARAIAMNMVSTGARLVSLSGDSVQAEIVLEGWPGYLGAEMFELENAQADEALAVFVPIAAHMGYEFMWRRDGEQIIAVIAR